MGTFVEFRLEKGDLIKVMRLGYLDEIFGLVEEVGEDSILLKYPMMNAVPRKYLEKPPVDPAEAMRRFMDTFSPVPMAGPEYPYAVVPSSYIFVKLDPEKHQWLRNLLEEGYSESMDSTTAAMAEKEMSPKH